ncbi:DNA glycosylase AlkZ-like family protein [Thermomonospora umbrina]|uniref:Winged helix DNA-binding protein n=1 Tax=Thermomonospora umbrina TaxID=111806 RepID=A0A3D9T1K7_9ACTN|nr:crosslink repair DNA glycosylase YcaQ family protein [Thermomonospora umbrina]REF00731.1 winged helix DNA-binding protein [Thermomonospora umbrina]
MAVSTHSPLGGGAAPYVLDEDAAVRMWNWLLARQGVADAPKLDTAVQVADAALGLHAARLPSPYAIVAARTGTPAAPVSLFTEQVRAELITVRCMRKTLHTLPLPLAAAAHVATLRFRDRDARRAVHNAGHPPAVIDQTIDRLRDLLGRHGPLHHRTIETHLAESNVPVQVTRLAVKVAWENGTLAYLNTTRAWNREVRVFDLTAGAYPALDLTMDRREAVAALIGAYFDRYGPSTIRDAMWWSGLSAADITTALRSLDRELVQVTTPWAEDPCWMFTDRLTEYRAGAEPGTGIALLAHEDTALKAYFQTRTRYLAGQPQRRAFNQIGEALPTIIVNGTVAGTWSWHPPTRRVQLDIQPHLTAAQRRRATAHADALTDTLRRAWTPHPPRTAPTGQLTLAIG